MHVPHLVVSLPHSRPCNTLATPARPRYLLSEGVFSLCCIALRVFPAFGFLLISISFAVALPCQRCIRCRFRISPWSSLLRWVLNPCVDLVLRSAVPAMAFTTASFTCWLRHQVHIRGSSSISSVSSPRQSRIGLWVTWLGLRTSRTCSHLFQFGPRTGRVCSRLFRVGNRQNRFGASCFVLLLRFDPNKSFVRR